jgi:hypothetical protein
MWQHYSTDEKKDAFIDPGIVRAVLPSRHGASYSLLVLDGGVKIHVSNGNPEEMRRSLLPLADFGGHELAESPTIQSVRAFAEAMEQRLSENRHKGDREGWLSEPEATHLNGALRHMESAEKAIAAGAPVDEVRRAVADAANRLMMLLDVHSRAGR